MLFPRQFQINGRAWGLQLKAVGECRAKLAHESVRVVELRCAVCIHQVKLKQMLIPGKFSPGVNVS